MSGQNGDGTLGFQGGSTETKGGLPSVVDPTTVTEAPKLTPEAIAKEKLVHLITEFNSTVTDPLHKTAGIINSPDLELIDPTNHAKGKFIISGDESSPSLDMTVYTWDGAEEAYASAVHYVLTPNRIIATSSSEHYREHHDTEEGPGFTNVSLLLLNQAEESLNGFLAPIKEAQAKIQATRILAETMAAEIISVDEEPLPYKIPVQRYVEVDGEIGTPDQLSETEILDAGNGQANDINEAFTPPDR